MNQNKQTNRQVVMDFPRHAGRINMELLIFKYEKWSHVDISKLLTYFCREDLYLSLQKEQTLMNCRNRRF